MRQSPSDTPPPLANIYSQTFHPRLVASMREMVEPHYSAIYHTDPKLTRTRLIRDPVIPHVGKVVPFSVYPFTYLSIEDQIVLQGFSNLYANKYRERKSNFDSVNVFSNYLTNKEDIFFLRKWNSIFEPS